MLPQLGSLKDMSSEEKINVLESYIRKLGEHIDWQLSNLDETNFTEEFLNRR